MMSSPTSSSPGSSALPLPAFPALPDIGQQTALFLDFDGTLVDLAAEPDAVQIAPELVPLLSRLESALGGALAIVSGRKLADLDHFLAPLRLASAAEHGAQRRFAGGGLISVPLPDLQEAAQAVTALAARYPELRIEIKAAGVAVHYRYRPELEAVCLQVMQRAAAATAGVELLRGKYVFEVKAVGVSKGSAIEAFMASAPFAGRVPVFAGDDVTDEAGFEVVQRLGGAGIKVGEGMTLAGHRCATPAACREWLQAALRCAQPAQQRPMHRSSL